VHRGRAGRLDVNPPFTYAPRSQEAYDEQRIAIAEQILVALQAPDIITIQEAEKQDVCVPVYDEETPVESFMDCDLSAPADGETMATDRARLGCARHRRGAGPRDLRALRR
jgi:uncharacterized protein